MVKDSLMERNVEMENNTNSSGSGQPSLSVVIPAYNSGKTIERCLKSVIDAVPESMQIIVVDDGSTDNTSKIASQFPVRLLTTSHLGLAEAKNKGLTLSTGDIVFFIDSDTILDKNFFVELVSALDRDGVGGAAGVVLLIKGSVVSVSLTVRLFGFSPINERDVREIDSIPGGCSAYHRKILVEMGGFDTDLYAMHPGAEDLDLNIRIRKKGYKLLIVPAAKIYHEHPTGFRKLAKKWFSYGVSFFNVCIKHSLYREIVQILGWVCSCFLLFFMLLWSGELLILPLLVFIFWVPWVLYYGKFTVMFWMRVKKVKYLAVPLAHQTMILSRTAGFIYGMFKALRPRANTKPKIRS
jgi:cellulose synthase/poly-beta-1,6-N-acetylglucosamine synthase-like glycosyltransferase